MSGCLSRAPYRAPGPQPRACALTGHRTGNSWVLRPALNPLSHTIQGLLSVLGGSHLKSQHLLLPLLKSLTRIISRGLHLITPGASQISAPGKGLPEGWLQVRAPAACQQATRSHFLYNIYYPLYPFFLCPRFMTSLPSFRATAPCPRCLEQSVSGSAHAVPERE